MDGLSMISKKLEGGKLLLFVLSLKMVGRESKVIIQR